MGESL